MVKCETQRYLINGGNGLCSPHSFFVDGSFHRLLKSVDFTLCVMMTSSNGNIFRLTGPLCGEFTGPRWIPRTKGQWRGALMPSLICAWTHAWVNNREAGDLRRYRAHFDVTVMCLANSWLNWARTVPALIWRDDNVNTTSDGCRNTLFRCTY